MLPPVEGLVVGTMDRFDEGVVGRPGAARPTESGDELALLAGTWEVDEGEKSGGGMKALDDDDPF